MNPSRFDFRWHSFRRNGSVRHAYALKQRPHDADQLAARVVALSTGQIEAEPAKPEKNPAAVALAS